MTFTYHSVAELARHMWRTDNQGRDLDWPSDDVRALYHRKALVWDNAIATINMIDAEFEESLEVAA